MSTFTAAAATDRSLIFTFAPESTVPADFPERVEAAMTAAGGRVRFVELRVSDAEQEKRIENPDRTEAGKLASLATLRSIRRQDEITPGGFTPWRADMVINTDASDAESSARHQGRLWLVRRGTARAVSGAIFGRVGGVVVVFATTVC